MPDVPTPRRLVGSDEDMQQAEALRLAAALDNNTSIVGAERIAAELRRLSALEARYVAGFRMLSYSHERLLTAMQAAVIDAMNKEPKDALPWIINSLEGPGLLPDDSETDAQAFFDRAMADMDACYPGETLNPAPPAPSSPSPETGEAG